jgi:hypothetical protein
MPLNKEFFTPQSLHKAYTEPTQDYTKKSVFQTFAPKTGTSKSLDRALARTKIRARKF